MFRILGALVGFFILGLLGIFLGYFIGSFIDRFKASGSSGMNPFNTPRRQSVFLETVFILMGKLAKADGRVSETEAPNILNNAIPDLAIKGVIITNCRLIKLF